jgi:hypothetical protein
VVAFARKTETGGRGGLHCHDLVNQSAMQPDRLEAFLAGAQRAAVLAFVERLMCGSLPDGWSIGHAGAHSKALPPDGSPLPRGLCVLTFAAWGPPLGADAPPGSTDAARARTLVDLQLHEHTARCKKGGHAGTDDDCALDGDVVRGRRAAGAAGHRARHLPRAGDVPRPGVQQRHVPVRRAE